MNQTSDMERLANAVAALAATITEMINGNLRHLPGGNGQAVSSVHRPQAASNANEPLLSKREVAEQLHVTVRTVDNWMRHGFLPFYKFGRTVRFKASDFQQCWDEKCRVLLRRQAR